MMSRTFGLPTTFSLGLGMHCATLVFMVLGICLLLTPVAWGFSGFDGAFAVGTAAAVCLVAAVAGLFAGILLPTENISGRVLLGMLLRMGIPLAFCIVAYHAPGRLAAAGLVYYVLIIYMTVLVADTCMASFRASRTSTSTKCE